MLTNAERTFYAPTNSRWKGRAMSKYNMTRRAALTVTAASLGFAGSARAEPPIEPPQGGTWRGGPALPYAAQEIYPAMHQGRIHLAGGFIANGAEITGATDRHIALDPASGVWSDAAALPQSRHHPILVSFAGTLLALGGFEVKSEQAVWVMQSGVWAYEGENWRDAPSLPQPNGESVVGVLGGQLHVSGGRHPTGIANASWSDHGDVADHFVLTGIADTWTRAAPLPTARNSAAAAIIGASWHVVGGRTVSGGNTAAHEVYDRDEDRWRIAAPMPQAQGGLAAAEIGGKLFAFGGEYFDNGGGVYPEVWMYEPQIDAWRAMPDMPNPRHGLGGVAVNQDIYLIGGARRVGGRETSSLVEIFSPSA